ncbi:hypothetical protein NL676_016715 [Syzygium grande]|nr:hypothetical protein NL676_016715 [Syzygium grande]
MPPLVKTRPDLPRILVSRYSPLKDSSPNWSNHHPMEKILFRLLRLQALAHCHGVPHQPQTLGRKMINTFIKTLASVVTKYRVEEELVRAWVLVSCSLKSCGSPPSRMPLIPLIVDRAIAFRKAGVRFPLRRRQRSESLSLNRQSPDMEEAIATLGRSLGHFCNHLQSSVDALNQSIDRRPIPLDSASSTFVQCLNRRVSTASGDLDLLDSMSFGTVSFEELLGHCNEVFKKNQSDLAQLEERLTSFGYVPDADDDDVEEDTVDDLSSPLKLDPNFPLANGGFDLPSSCSGRLTASVPMTKFLKKILSILVGF